MSQEQLTKEVTKILSKAEEPIKSKQIARQIDGVTKKDVNRVLYGLRRDGKAEVNDAYQWQAAA